MNMKKKAPSAKVTTGLARARKDSATQTMQENYKDPTSLGPDSA